MPNEKVNKKVFAKMINVGSCLRALRKGKELTLKDVSSKTGLSVSFLSEIERGKVGLS